MTDKIVEGHLNRSAVVYIRQSTLQQVRNNTESGRRQYALEGKARELGFKTVVVIDEDLGVSGTGTRERPGFARLLAAVCNGEVGAVFALEASRLARNNRDWHHLIDLCVLTETLVVDAEAVYDPRLLNDRMLLGLKGTMSEFEIGILRQRAQEAYRQKVQRGEVMTMVPIGYERCGSGGIEMTSDRQIQEAIRCLFARLEAMGTLRQVVLWYHQEQMTFPRQRRRQGVTTIEWRLPDYKQLHHLVKNPTYAGAFAHGKSRTQTSVVGGRSRKSSGRRVAMEQWPVLIKDHHAGYITWERYVRNVEMLNANSTRAHGAHAGAPRTGSALLSGLLRCGKCGLKLAVAYRGGEGANGRYQCLTGSREQGKPVCQSFAAFRVDQAVEAEVLGACQPLAVEASLLALSERKAEVEQKRRLLEIALEKARYEVDRARRQYDAVDPANRLVASELETRWNVALTHSADAEARLVGAMGEQKPLSEEQRQQILALGANLGQLWNDPRAPLELKKRILRTAIREIVVGVDEAQAKIDLVVHWAGGAHTKLRVAKNKSGRNKSAASQETVELVRELARGWSDPYIAQMLNRIGSRTGPGNAWSEARVKSFRGQHAIPVFSAGDVRPWLTMEEAAAELSVNVSVIRTMVKQGKLPARQSAAGLPWMIERRDLASGEVIARVRDVKTGRRSPREEPRQIVMHSI
jgi:DNA invertase Pin-like site-specific DNA recombinase